MRLWCSGVIPLIMGGDLQVGPLLRRTVRDIWDTCHGAPGLEQEDSKDNSWGRSVWSLGCPTENTLTPWGDTKLKSFLGQVGCRAKISQATAMP